MLHGEAIAIGMIAESYLSHKFADLQQEELNEICDFILSVYPSYKVDENSFDDLLAFMKNDKKMRTIRSISLCSIPLEPPQLTIIAAKKRY